MIAALVAAACAPIVTSGAPVEAIVALAGATGGGYISEFIKGVIDRLQSQDGRRPRSQAEVQRELERELLACLQAHDERAARLRIDAGALLESVQGVQAALEAASYEVKLALTDAFGELSGEFSEFGWMLDESLRTLAAIQRTQRYQIDLTRQMQVKINLLVGRQAAPAEPIGPDEPVEKPCPYMGLAAFQPEDAHWFFGRQRLVAELIARLSETSFLAVLGPSGSGKSSVLRAGLLPAIWDGAPPGADVWATIVVTPGRRPSEELAFRLSAQCDVAARSLLGDWRAEPAWLRMAVRQVLTDAPDGARLLLLVDQFEEIFTLCEDEGERLGFIRALAALVSEADNPAIVVLGIRADFYARCGEYPELVDVVQDRQLLVGPMTPGELREAITSPAARAGLALEPGLVEMVLADLGEEPGSLPLLSHALFATWQCRQGDTLEVEGYRGVGRIRQAIGQTASAVYARLEPVEQGIAKDVFLRLTALGEGTEDTRRRARRAEVLDGRDAIAVEGVLDRLAEARLVILDEDSVQVAHEALIREWPMLQGWLAEDREGLRIHRRLTEAAGEWEALGRDPGALYRGVRLAGAREWAEGREARLNTLERAFLAASDDQEREEREAAQRRNRRRLRRVQALAGVLAVLLVLTGMFGVVTVQRQRRDATARQLAAQATANLDQPALPLLLSLESLRVARTNEGLSSLLQALLEPSHEGELTGHTGSVRAVAFSPDGATLASGGQDGTVRLWDPITGQQIGQPLTGHEGLVIKVAFSPDGATLASASDDGTVRLWDPATGQQIGQPLTGHEGPVIEVAFSPGGATLASAGADGAVRLWDPATGQQIGQPLTQLEGSFEEPAFSPDSGMLASGGFNYPVRLWNLATGELIGQLPSGPVVAVAFSPDGATLASASFDGTRLWNLATGEQIDRLPTGPVFAVTFSPDGATLASAGDSGAVVRLWDTATGQQIGPPLTGHTDVVTKMAFSPDGATLASASRDGTVRVRNLNTGAPIDQPLWQSLNGHTDSVISVAFSPDGDMLVSASLDETLRLWNPATGQQIGQPLNGHEGPVFAVAFSPDGTRIASAGDDGAVRLWNPATGQQIGQLPTGRVRGVAFSPDGSRLASAGQDGTVRLWDPATGQQIGQPLTGHEGGVGGVAFSPDGSRLASAGADGAVRLWDPAIGQQIGEPLTGHEGPVTAVAFSPDGTTLASASGDNTVRFWDPATGEQIGQPLTGHTDTVTSVAFSPDGATLASASDDATVRLWDPATSQQIGSPLTGHLLFVYGVAFSPDGAMLASAGDVTVRLWPVTVEAWIEHACTLASRNLTQDEWDQFVGAGRPYVRTCPDLPSGSGAPADAPPATYHLD